MNTKTILITGVGTGIGRGAAVALSKLGHKVIATTHTQQGADDLKKYTEQQQCTIMEIFKLDITDAEDQQKIKDYELDALINVAGIGSSGPLAEIPMDQLRAIFETNVFGTITISQIALAKMMQRKSGRVIIVSSLAGRVPIPFLSPYAVSKFALSGGAAAMRSEVHQVEPNVHVSLVEPGSYHTGFNQRMQQKKYEWISPQSPYYKILPQLRENDARFALLEKKTTDSIVKQIVKAVEARKPKLRYSAPWYQALGARLLRILGV